MYQRQVSFKEAVTRALTANYCNFNGRSSRSEYWWFCLFATIAGAVVSAIFSFNDNISASMSGLVTLALLLPGLGLAVRRLHDIGKSGLFVLLALIPLVGSIILIVWFCRPSMPQANQYGDVPNT